MDKRHISIRRYRYTPELNSVLRGPFVECFDGYTFPNLNARMVWLAAHGDKTVGFAVAHNVGEQLCIEWMGVVVPYRKLGIQRRMLAAIMRFGDKLGLPIITYTSVQNASSSNNFIACGFKTAPAPDAREWITWVRKPQG